MSSNITKFKADLDRLVQSGRQIRFAFVIEAQGKKAVAEALKLTDEQMAERIAELPKFRESYQSWYSESLVLIKQVMPDRLADFKDHYEVPKTRKDITYANYRIHDALKGLRISRGGEVLADFGAAMSHLEQQLYMVEAAAKRFESSLFEIRQLVQADLFDSELMAARELLKNKFFRAAGAMAGVVLEKHLRQVCGDHNITISKKNPGIADLNELLKSNDVISIPQWRHITLLGDYRNLCDHNKQTEPTKDQVTDLIDGTDKVLKTVM